MKGDSNQRGFATRAIHAGQQPEPVTGAVNVPIFQTSTYVQPELGAEVDYDYARVKNPTRTALEDNIASLESGVAGHAFASGMAALTAMFTTMRSDEHVIVSHNVYGGTYRLLEQVLDRYRLRASWIDTTDLDAVAAVMEEQTRWVLIESPTNPMMDITDISAVCDVAHARGAKVAVDNTFLSPYFQRPIELGADLVMHSATKYLGGHSDCLGGLLVTNDPADAEWYASSRSPREPSWRRSRPTSFCAASRPYRCAWSATSPTRESLSTPSPIIPRSSTSTTRASPTTPVTRSRSDRPPGLAPWCLSTSARSTPPKRF